LLTTDKDHIQLTHTMLYYTSQPLPQR